MGQVAMNMSEKLDLEEIIRTNFNKIYNASTEKRNYLRVKQQVNMNLIFTKKVNTSAG